MPKQVWILIIATSINVTGASFIWPLNTIYMHNELGESLTFAGLILMFNQGAAIVGNLVGGTLFDKIGGYRTILSGGALTLISAVVLTQFHSLVPYSILLIVMGLGSGVIVPAMFAMATSVWPKAADARLMRSTSHKTSVSPWVLRLVVLLLTILFLIFFGQMLPFLFCSISLCFLHLNRWRRKWMRMLIQPSSVKG